MKSMMRFLFSHLLILIGLALLTNGEALAQTQLGQDIDGEAFFDQSGESVSLSSDGQTVAIGAPFNNGDGGSDNGHVRVYSFNSGTSMWEQKGPDIDGEDFNDRSGRSVSLSSDGQTVAIGAPGNNFGSGHVRVYRFNSSTSMWEQRGQDIDGEVSDQLGRSVSLSSDGQTVAIGAFGHDDFRGRVQVYSFNSSTSMWEQKGMDIDGEDSNDESGSSGLSLSSDGQTVAIGAPGNNGLRGHVRVYSFNSSTSMWEQKGMDIDGDNSFDLLGASVSLSSDGQTVAVGAIENNGGSGSVGVYSFNNSTSMWELKGQNIDGEDMGDQLGTSVSLSSDGQTVAIGALLNEGSNGRVGVYSFNSSTSMWELKGMDINGQGQSGTSVSLSSDGETVAIGVPRIDDNRGRVQVYEYSTCSITNPELVENSMECNGDDVTFDVRATVENGSGNYEVVFIGTGNSAALTPPVVGSITNAATNGDISVEGVTVAGPTTAVQGNFAIRDADNPNTCLENFSVDLIQCPSETIPPANITDSPSIGDPCSCSDPQNIQDNDGLITHFHDILTITGGAPNAAVVLTIGGANFLNSSLTQIPTGNIGTTDANGNFSLDFWHASGASGSITVTVGGVATNPSSLALSVCNAADCEQSNAGNGNTLTPIPTMSEWGLIIFGLLILNLSVFFIRQKEVEQVI